MKFSFNNSKIKKQDFENIIESLKKSLDAKRDYPFVLNHKKVIDECDQVAGNIETKKLKLFVLIGIGGSNLGTEAIVDAIGIRKNIKFIVFDTFSETKIKKLKEEIKNVNSEDEFLINIVSKSGSTLETLVNTSLVFSIFKLKFSSFNKRVVVTTDYNSKLWNLAEKEGFCKIQIPAELGGRYSVFSGVGIFPFKILGLNIKKFLEGVKCANNISQSFTIENYALVSSIFHYWHFKNGKNISNLFLFTPELETLGKWYRQLLAESLGKRVNKSNRVVRTGITPYVSIGTTDLHSLQQLFVGGPDDKFHTFVYSEDLGEYKIDLDRFKSILNIKNNLPIKYIKKAVYNGVKESFEFNEIPFLDIEFDKEIEFDLGYFMQSKMFEIYFLGELFGVNVFDQPEVEDYKNRTKKRLK
jgi:glucose-6-phosphate isomerase